MPRKLTFLFWDIKNKQKKVHTGLKRLSTSNGRATILNLLNTNQIYNLYFKSSSYLGFIILSTLRPVNTHTLQIWLKDSGQLWEGKQTLCESSALGSSVFLQLETRGGGAGGGE